MDDIYSDDSLSEDIDMSIDDKFYCYECGFHDGDYDDPGACVILCKCGKYICYNFHGGRECDLTTQHLNRCHDCMYEWCGYMEDHTICISCTYNLCTKCAKNKCEYCDGFSCKECTRNSNGYIHCYRCIDICKENIKENRLKKFNIIKEELIQKTWHPNRFIDWCLDEDDKKEFDK